jgi:hypothetical protein
VIRILKCDFWRGSFAKIYFSGWWSGLGAIGLGMTISLLLFGFRMPYWKVADQDMILAYQALLFNDGRPQEYFDHTGYLSDLAIAAWYQLLHWLGILHAYSLSTLPSPNDAAAYDHAWQYLIASGRVLSLLLGVGFVWLFATLTRRVVGDSRIAIMAAIALAYSGGVAWHIRIMRTELLSAAFETLALLLLLVAARERDIGRNVMVVAVAALCATLAVVAKVQALLPVLVIPAVVLAFGQGTQEPGDCDLGLAGRRRWMLATGFVLLAVIVAYPATELLRLGIARGIGAYRPLEAGLSGVYQWLIGLWVTGAVVAYAIVWRIPPAITVAVLAGVSLGVCGGLFSMWIYYDVANVVAVVNPIEHMRVIVFGPASPVLAQATEILSAMFRTVAMGLGAALARHSFVFSPSGRPTLMLEWLAIAGTAVMWRRGERRAAMQVGLLILAAWAIDAMFSVRNLQLAYTIYTDPLLIIAAAMTVARFPELQKAQRVQNAALGLMMIYLVWGHLQPVRQAMTRGHPEETCQLLPSLNEVGPFSICRQ